MRRLLIAAGFIGLFVAFSSPGTAQDKEEAKKKAQQTRFAEMLKISPEDFIKRFDKNSDGLLSKDELPPGLAMMFDRFDTDKNGTLDKKEVEEMLKALRARAGDAKPPETKPETKPKTTPEKNTTPEKTNPQIERIVDDMLSRMDTNKDGKISKEEAKNLVAENFARIDTNGDGFIDRNELRQFAARMFAQQGGGRPGGPNRPGLDFDALDKDADGRLTREEVKGSPLADKFDEIDTNKDGKIDVKEFRAYLKKQEEKKEEKKDEKK